jgi:phosphatidylglycerophosphate synthase
MKNSNARRPLKSRQTQWAKRLAKFLADSGISPNMISFTSMLFAGCSLIACIYAKENASRISTVFAAVFIQLRLMCNLMDGMVAVEFGKKSKTGDLWNDVPDRFADVFIILGTLFFAKDYPFAQELAWGNAVLAVMTAYLRVLGASLKSPHYYIGPMAKPHRMDLLTLAFLIEAIYPTGKIAYSALIIMGLGQIVTCYRRLSKIAVDLEME